MTLSIPCYRTAITFVIASVLHPELFASRRAQSIRSFADWVITMTREPEMNASIGTQMLFQYQHGRCQLLKQYLPRKPALWEVPHAMMLILEIS